MRRQRVLVLTGCCAAFCHHLAARSCQRRALFSWRRGRLHYPQRGTGLFARSSAGTHADSLPAGHVTAELPNHAGDNEIAYVNVCPQRERQNKCRCRVDLGGIIHESISARRGAARRLQQRRAEDGEAQT